MTTYISSEAKQSLITRQHDFMSRCLEVINYKNIYINNHETFHMCNKEQPRYLRTKYVFICLYLPKLKVEYNIIYLRNTK